MIYKNVSGAIVCDVPDDTLLDMDEIELLVENTANTWQVTRKKDEIRKDTIQGKKAEIVLEKFLETNSECRFIAYDSFRNDQYKKHAPLDGILIENSLDKSKVDYFITRINDEVKSGDYGIITPNLRADMVDNRIYSVEIKSSSLKKKDYEGVNNHEARSNGSYQRIVANINKWDFFTYPHYLRKSDNISSFYEYAEFVRNQYESDFPSGNEAFLKKLIQDEYNSDSDIYTRLYFDYCKNEIYIPGYIVKDDFFRKPHLSRMPGSKSGKAIYYMHSISAHTSFFDLDKDERMWNYDRMIAYKSFLQEKKGDVQIVMGN